MLFHPTKILIRFLPSLATFALLSLASCQAFLPKEKTANSNEVAAFLDTVKANGAPRGIKKTVTSEGQTNSVTLPAPNLDRELAFFSKAVLSEAYLKGYYTLDSTKEAGNSTMIYRANSPKPEVRTLVLVRDGNRHIIGVHVEAVQNNYLYEDSLNATLFAEQVENRYRLTDYKVEGRQKMLLGRYYEFDIYAKAL